MQRAIFGHTRKSATDRLRTSRRRLGRRRNFHAKIRRKLADDRKHCARAFRLKHHFTVDNRDAGVQLTQPDVVKPVFVGLFRQHLEARFRRQTIRRRKTSEQHLRGTGTVDDCGIHATRQKQRRLAGIESRSIETERRQRDGVSGTVATHLFHSPSLRHSHSHSGPLRTTKGPTGSAGSDDDSSEMTCKTFGSGNVQTFWFGNLSAGTYTTRKRCRAVVDVRSTTRRNGRTKRLLAVPKLRGKRGMHFPQCARRAFRTSSARSRSPAARQSADRSAQT